MEDKLKRRDGVLQREVRENGGNANVTELVKSMNLLVFEETHWY